MPTGTRTENILRFGLEQRVFSASGPSGVGHTSSPMGFVAHAACCPAVQSKRLDLCCLLRIEGLVRPLSKCAKRKSLWTVAQHARARVYGLQTKFPQTKFRRSSLAHVSIRSFWCLRKETGEVLSLCKQCHKLRSFVFCLSAMINIGLAVSQRECLTSHSVCPHTKRF